MLPQDLKSSYWKINNSQFDYASNSALANHADTIAVSSNYANENLRIYQLAANSLIHLASITLPDIHSLKFLKPVSNGPHDFKFLLSGHSNGILHLSAIPLTENSSFENAEIIKRINHKKVLEASSRDISYRHSYVLNNGRSATTITSLDISPASWSSAPLNSTVVVYDHHLFYWDTTRSTDPISFINKSGISHASANKRLDSLVSTVGDFGLSFVDLRQPYHGSQVIQNYGNTGYTSSHWCESDQHLLATVPEYSNSIQLWDIRKLTPMTTLTDIPGTVNDVKWKGDTLWASDNSGYLTKWNISLNSIIPNQQTSLNDNDDVSQTQISNSPIAAIAFANEDPNNTDLVCIDNVSLSTHKPDNNVWSKKQQKLIPLQPPQIQTARHENDFAILADSTCTTPESEKFNFFDNKPVPTTPNYNSSHGKSNSRRCSDETLPASEASMNWSGDYLVDFQKEVTEMIRGMDTKTVGNMVYL